MDIINPLVNLEKKIHKLNSIKKNGSSNKGIEIKGYCNWKGKWYQYHAIRETCWFITDRWNLIAKTKTKTKRGDGEKKRQEIAALQCSNE